MPEEKQFIYNLSYTGKFTVWEVERETKCFYFVKKVSKALSSYKLSKNKVGDENRRRRFQLDLWSFDKAELERYAVRLIEDEQARLQNMLTQRDNMIEYFKNANKGD